MWGHVPFQSGESTPLSASLLPVMVIYSGSYPSAPGAMLVCLFLDSSEAFLRAAMVISFSLQDFLQLLWPRSCSQDTVHLRAAALSSPLLHAAHLLKRREMEVGL